MAPEITPVGVEELIRGVAERMAKGVPICAERYATYLAASHAYDLAYARAYLGGQDESEQPPAHERRYRAEIAAAEQRQARDVADAAYRHADRTARALEHELRALQSLGASLRAQYGVAGVGER